MRIGRPFASTLRGLQSEIWYPLKKQTQKVGKQTIIQSPVRFFLKERTPAKYTDTHTHFCWDTFKTCWTKIWQRILPLLQPPALAFHFSKKVTCHTPISISHPPTPKQFHAQVWPIQSISLSEKASCIKGINRKVKKPSPVYNTPLAWKGIQGTTNLRKLPYTCCSCAWPFHLCFFLVCQWRCCRTSADGGYLQQLELEWILGKFLLLLWRFCREFPCFSPPFGVTNRRFGRYHLPRLDANQRNIANGYTQNDAIKTIILGIQYPCERSWVYITWEKALGWKTEPHDKSQWLLWFYGSLLCSLHGSGNICFQLATLQRGIHGHLVSMKMVTPSGILSFLSFAIFCS